MGRRYRVRLYADLLGSFKHLCAEPGRYGFRDARVSVFYKRNVRSEIRTRVLDDVN